MIVSAIAAALAFAASPASARSVCSGMIVSCDNGRDYPLCPIAVSEAGEIVTGHLTVAPRRSVRVRLVPMGTGYRYIGPDVWLDGVRSEAVLHFGKHRSLTCSVARNGN